MQIKLVWATAGVGVVEKGELEPRSLDRVIALLVCASHPVANATIASVASMISC